MRPRAAARRLALALLLTPACGGAPVPRRPPYPASEPGPTVDLLHGEPVPDPYRWLEDGESPRVQAWTAAQNALTARWMAAWPGRDRLRARLDAAFDVGWVSAPQVAGGRAFWLERAGDEDQPRLVVRAVDDDGPPRLLLDVGALSADGTVALDWLHASPSGRRLAYGLSEGGTERSVLHVMDVDAGADLGLRIPGTRAAAVAWLPGDDGFYYTRYPVAGTRDWPEVAEEDASYHRHVYLHRLGGDWRDDPRVFGEGRPREEWPSVLLSPDGAHLVLEVSRGWSESSVFTRAADAPPDAPWRTVADVPGARHQPLAADGALYLLTDHGAPHGRLLRVPWDAPDLAHAEVVVPEPPDRVLRDAALVGGHLALEWLREASSRLTVHRLDGTLLREVPLPALGSVEGFGGEPDRGDLYFAFSSYAVPSEVLRVPVDPAPGAGQPAVFVGVETPEDLGDVEVSLHRTTSADGTEVTLFVVHRRGLPRDGEAPTVLYGYGGFNIALTPGFARNVQPFLADGGVYAVAHLRGGGEYGEAWHRAGMLDQKERVFEDFEACARYLVEAGYTRPERLAVMGGSNGGLLAGAAVVRFPDRFRAAVVRVPLLDMLRYHRFSIARLWIPEYGDPDDAAAFRWLRAYSPYHHVPERFRGPAVLLLAAEGDTRVDPLHARKFAARLQQAAAGPAPVLLRIETKAGHGAGKPTAKVVEEYLDIWTFLYRELGVQPAG